MKIRHLDKYGQYFLCKCDHKGTILFLKAGFTDELSFTSSNLELVGKPVALLGNEQFFLT